MLDLVVKTRTQLLDDLIVFNDSLDAIVADLAEELQREIAPDLLDELQYYPGPRGSEIFIWSTDPGQNTKARRWYFAAIARGDIETDGSHYIRSGGYADSWSVAFGSKGNQHVIRIHSSDPGAIWVGGSLNQRSRGEAVRWQIPGHATTGWPIQVDTANYWVEVAVERFGEKFAQRLGEFGTIGKTTRRSRRK